MEAGSKFRSFLLAMCLVLVFPNNGIGVAFVKGQSTNSYDAIAFYTLQITFPQLYVYVTDPCYPVPVSWIECSNDYLARITALNLGGRNLVGQMPDFSIMDALEIIDLHDNSLSGPIPAFLGTFYYLRTLNLADNFFTGAIPSSLANSNNLVKDFSGNPGLDTSSIYTSPPGSTTTPSSGSNPPSSTKPKPSEDKKSSKLPIILGIVGAVVVISAVVGVIAIHLQRQRTAAVIQAATVAQSNAAIANGAPPAGHGAFNTQYGATNQ